MIAGVGSKVKTISDQLAKFIIENFTKPIAASAPTAPPSSARKIDSSRNETGC